VRADFEAFISGHSFYQGYHVFAGVRKEADKQRVIDACNARVKKAGSCDGLVIPVILDVTQDSHISKLAQDVSSWTTSHSLPLVALVNNAAQTKLGPIEAESMQTFRDCLLIIHCEFIAFSIFHLEVDHIPFLASSQRKKPYSARS
jgi:NAD(P)-dependent dehydrogenase (short-subunit alcohol dehydrogenase family)